MKKLTPSTIKTLSIGIAVCMGVVLSGCDRVNNANRTMDTMLGGDYDVYVQGITEPFHVIGGKVTSVPEKGYYIYYPTIDGKKRLVQSPLQITTIVKKD